MPTRPVYRQSLCTALHLAAWAVAWAVCALLAGCVMAGYGSEDTTITRTEPSATAGAPPIVTVTRTKKKHATYSDTTQAGNAASQVFGEFGGIGGILANISTGGLAAGGAGILGLLGIGAKTVHTIGKRKGEDIGWEDREKAANVQQPLPAVSSNTGAST